WRRRSRRVRPRLGDLDDGRSGDFMAPSIPATARAAPRGLGARQGASASAGLDYARLFRGGVSMNRFSTRIALAAALGLSGVALAQGTTGPAPATGSAVHRAKSGQATDN